MALQLTPFMGTTAFPDRMGSYYPELLEAGRIVQGYDVSGAMSSEITEAVDRDLSDTAWRSIFYKALQHNHRFQRGLFDVSQLPQPGGPGSEGTPVWSGFTQDFMMDQPYSVDTVRSLSLTALTSEEIETRYEYGWAMIKTAAALIYTIRLCHQNGLVAVTDSASHHRLLTHTCQRDRIDLANSCMSRDGY